VGKPLGAGVLLEVAGIGGVRDRELSRISAYFDLLVRDIEDFPTHLGFVLHSLAHDLAR